jgi:hypothetical protein
VALLLWGLWRRRFGGREYLLPLCGLGTLGLLLLQGEGVMEARFREPIDAILLAAVWLMLARDPAGPQVNVLAA